MQSSTHSLQMKTLGPEISLATSIWLLPQKEQESLVSFPWPAGSAVPLPRRTIHGARIAKAAPMTNEQAMEISIWLGVKFGL